MLHVSRLSGGDSSRVPLHLVDGSDEIAGRMLQEQQGGVELLDPLARLPLPSCHCGHPDSKPNTTGMPRATCRAGTGRAPRPAFTASYPERPPFGRALRQFLIYLPWST